MAMAKSPAFLSRVRRFASNPLRLLIVALLPIGAVAHLVRQDIALTRITVNRPEGASFKAVFISPQAGQVIGKLWRSGWQYTSRGADTFRPSAALEQVRTELKAVLPNSSQHQKLWDFLDESYVAGPDVLPGKALATFAASIHITEPINQAGLCDYLFRRVIPAFNTFLARNDYAGARAISVEANAWIDAMKPNPQLATEFPRMQGYINLFRKLDALLDDPAFLYVDPDAAAKLIEYLREGKAAPPSLVNYLVSNANPELAAWGQYMSAAGKLTALRYGEAERDFLESAKLTKNRKLADLASLGRVRAVFWEAMSGATTPATASQTISSTAFAHPRYSADAQFYVERLTHAGQDTAKGADQ